VSTGVEAKKRNRAKIRVQGVSMLSTTQLLGNQSRGLSGCRTVCYPKKNQPSLSSWCLKKKKKYTNLQ